MLEEGKCTVCSSNFNSAESGQIDLDVDNNKRLDNVRYSMDSDVKTIYSGRMPFTKVYALTKDKTIANIAPAGQVDLQTMGNEILDSVRYSILGDTRHLYTVIKDTNVFVLDKKTNIVGLSSRKFKVGSKVHGFGEVTKIFKIRVTKGDTNSIIQKKISFVIIKDNKEKSFLVNKKDLQEMIGKSSFEGGDIEDFYGGDVNFSGVSNKLFGFDSNADIPLYDDNTKMYFNMDSNVDVRGEFESNADIDLSFDANKANEVIDNIYSIGKQIIDKTGTSKNGSTKNNSTTTNSSKGNSSSKDDSNNDTQTKILGMHPVTFGIVSAVALVGLGVGIWLYNKK